MKNKMLSMACGLLIGLSGMAQSSSDNNTPAIGNHLGWDDVINTELDIRQNNSLRTRFSSDPTWNGLNGLTENNASRITFGLNGDGNHAWSVLHVWDGFLSNTMYRSWFNIGTSYTGSADFMYTGLLQRPDAALPNAATDAVVAWGCNVDDGFLGPDNLRFLFISPTNANPAFARQTEQGMEAMRITPMGNVGIGDFSNNGFGLNEQPSHRLDVDGTARLRQVQTDDADVLITGIEEDAVGDYELNYLAFPQDNTLVLDGTGNWTDVSNFADCDWENDGTNVWMGTAVDCIQGNVGIGMNNPQARLDVLANFSNLGGNNFGERIQAYGGTGASYGLYSSLGTGPLNASESYGVYGMSQGSLDKNWGGYFVGVSSSGSTSSVGCAGEASDASGSNAVHTGLYGTATLGRSNYGVDGHATADENSIWAVGTRGEVTTVSASIGGGSRAFGVYGVATINPNNCGHQVAGVYGRLVDLANCPPASFEYAGYFLGNVEVNGQLTVMGAPVLTSDENLKTNIVEMETTLDKVMQLKPVTYDWNQEANPSCDLPGDHACGFLAQDLEEIFPSLVETIATMDVTDPETGAVQAEGQEYLGIKYTELIPVLTKAIQEQQAILEAQQEQIEELTALISSCCEMDERSMEEDGYEINILKNENSAGRSSLGQNHPNPFNNKTTIGYSLACDCRATIKAYDSMGRVLSVLLDEEQHVGAHTIQWQTNELSPGVYYYSLEVDGTEMVRKAIKMD